MEKIQHPAYMTRAEKEALQSAAKKSGRSLSGYLVNCGLRDALARFNIRPDTKDA